ncbi:MAG TPA: erythromycin esterase family protein [Steroidobacteraceae bacterium]|nr:erythromycin esterase family protein [Steroidobacteraceae bacterium]
MIGNAQLVALSEGVHGGAEPLEFRNELFRYLVEQRGFTAIAIESGSVEGRVVHDYVRGGPGSLSYVMANGFSWTFGRLPQNRALVRWLRDYNADARHTRKINFYGFDVPGSPGNARAKRGMDTALREALTYLSGVDPASAAALQRRLGSTLDRLRFDLARPPGAPGYDELSQAERDALTATIADLVTLLERREGVYVTASSASDYTWAYRAAIGARQADSWLRQMPVNWQPARPPVRFPSAPVSFLSAASDVRDRAQADNLDWIVRQEGASGKVLIYASRYHLSATSIGTAGFLPNGSRQFVAGTYLRRRFGPRLVTIGNLIGGGSWGCPDSGTLGPAPPQSMDGIAGELHVPSFLLDLRTAPVPVVNWLDEAHQIGQGSNVFHLTIGEAFDILLYLGAVTPAC